MPVIWCLFRRMQLLFEYPGIQVSTVKALRQSQSSIAESAVHLYGSMVRGEDVKYEGTGAFSTGFYFNFFHKAPAQSLPSPPAAHIYGGNICSAICYFGDSESHEFPGAFRDDRDCLFGFGKTSHGLARKSEGWVEAFQIQPVQRFQVFGVILPK